MWFNSLVASAGGQILTGPTTPGSARGRRSAARIIRKLAHSKARRPVAVDPAGGPEPARPSRPARAAFQVNYPFIYPSREGQDAAKIFQKHRLGAVPAGRRPSSRPAADRRHQLGRRRATPSTRRQAFAAAACLRRAPRTSVEVASRRAAAHARDALRRHRSSRRPIPFADAHPQVDRGRRACARSSAGLRGRLAGDRTRPLARRPRSTRTTSIGKLNEPPSRTPSSSRALL